MKVVKRGGKMAIIGLPLQDEIGLNVPLIADNELDIYGVFRYSNTYPQGIEFLKTTELKSLITDRYTLEEIKEAMERARLNKKVSLKVMV